MSMISNEGSWWNILDNEDIWSKSSTYYTSNQLIQVMQVKQLVQTITLPKAQRAQRLSSYHKSWLNFNFKISIKHLKILTKDQHLN